jgi:TolB protein
MLRAATLLLACTLFAGACVGSGRGTGRSAASSPSASSATSVHSPVSVSASPSASPRPGRLELALVCGHSICRSHADGRGLRHVTEGRLANDRNPLWSPDGSRIVFDRSTSGGNQDLYAVDLDGSNLVRLTSEPSDESQPEWSPDGRRIAFTSDRDGTPEVNVAEADGSTTTRLTVSAGSSDPTWAPDGLRVVLVAVGVGLALVDLRAATVQPIATEDTDAHPRWSPAGDLVAFVRGSGRRAGIFTITPERRRLHRVTRGLEPRRDPAWGLIPL